MLFQTYYRISNWDFVPPILKLDPRVTVLSWGRNARVWFGIEKLYLNEEPEENLFSNNYCPGKCSEELSERNKKSRMKTLKAEWVPVGTPSLKTVILMPLIYLFGMFPIDFVAGFFMALIGMPVGTPEKLAGGFLIVMALLGIFFCLMITWLLMKRYSTYFFTDAWKVNFYSHLAVGLKWSIPVIVFTGFIVYGSFNTDFRLSMIKAYLATNRVPLENISGTLLILLSVSVLVQTFLEELIFRGMIQQHIKKFVSPRKSVLITAVIFTLSHFFSYPIIFFNVGLWFVAGILTGFAFDKFNSCISSFIPHLLLNIKNIIIIPAILIF